MGGEVQGSLEGGQHSYEGLIRYHVWGWDVEILKKVAMPYLALFW